ncbi:MAG: acyl-CoA dehydrogenase family protein, partial [Candidatus Binatia bacterium]
MEFEFTQEHEELRQTVRRFLEKESPEAVVRGVMETERGYDERVWSRMAEELALPGLVVPEAHGGAGYSFVELAIVLEEMGRALLCAPYLSTAVLATTALLHAAGEAARAEILPGIAAGRTIATLAFAEASGRWEPSGVALRARRDGATWLLEGTKDFVPDGHVADVILVAARSGEGLSLFSVEG